MTEIKVYTVEVSMRFDASSPEDAVRQMAVWLREYGDRAGMRVIHAPEVWSYIDAEEVLMEYNENEETD